MHIEVKTIENLNTIKSAEFHHFPGLQMPQIGKMVSHVQTHMDILRFSSMDHKVMILLPGVWKLMETYGNL